MFLRSLRELIMNEDCFMINLYLKSKEGTVRVRKDDDFYNLIDRDEGHAGNGLEKFMKRLLKEHWKADNTTQQTFLLFTKGWELISNIEQYFLKSLQKEKNWAIITFEYESCFPKHRLDSKTSSYSI